MKPTTSERIVMTIGRLGMKFNKPERPEGKEDRPESPMGGRPPMGPGGMPPMGPPPEARVLALLKTTDRELKRPEIGMIIGLPPKANNEMLEKLAEEGLIALRQDPEDEKKKYVSITEAGLEKIEQNKAAKRAKADAFLANLSEEEKETLLSLLEKIK